MAVTPDKIKARLKAKYPKANLSTKRLDALAAKLATKPADDADDDAIDAVLDQANDFYSFEDMARDDDRVRTLEANQKDKPNPAPAPEPTPTPQPTPTPDDAPAWAKGLIESNQKFAAELEAIKTGKLTEIKKTTAQAAFEKSEVLKGLKPELKESWINRINVGADTTDEDIATQVATLETEYSEIRQTIADSGEYTRLPGAGGGGAPKFSEEEAAKIVDNIL